MSLSLLTAICQQHFITEVRPQELIKSAIFRLFGVQRGSTVAITLVYYHVMSFQLKSPPIPINKGYEGSIHLIMERILSI